MLHIYRLKNPYYNANKNKIEIKTLHILHGVIGHAGSNKVSPLISVLFSVFFPAPFRNF